MNSVTRAAIMFQLLTILLAVTAVVTKAGPLTGPYPSFSQINVATVDLENISTPVYIVDPFTNIRRPEQNQVISNDDRVNVVRSFPNLVTGEYCGPGCCQEVTLLLYCLYCEHQITYSHVTPPTFRSLWSTRIQYLYHELN